MQTNNTLTYSTKIMGEIAFSVLIFPFWWYTKGLLQTLSALMNFLREKQQALALAVWIKNILRPMYGQSDFAGVLISIFIRLIQIIFRGTVMLFWTLIAIVLLLIWLGIPILIGYEIIFQLT